MPSYVYDNALIYNVNYNAVINNVYDNALIYVTLQVRRRLQTRGLTGRSSTPAAVYNSFVTYMIPFYLGLVTYMIHNITVL